MTERAGGRVRRLAEADWALARDLRLCALADAPDAFAATLADERGFPEARWRGRLAREDAATFVALHADRPSGIVVGGPFDDGAGLFSLWVAPAARGHGLGAALVRAVIAWAGARGHGRVLLDVGDDNAPAVALYAALGFQPTGRTGTLPPPRTHVREHQRALELPPATQGAMPATSSQAKTTSFDTDRG
jgi:ribosomal protein S18 acetylase RimI-like enzyme